MQIFFPKMLHHFTIHQQYLRVPIFLHPLYLIRAIKISVKWYHIAILICITLMTKDVKRLFRCLLVTCMGLLFCSEKCVLRFFSCIFYLDNLSFYCWVVRVLYIFWMQVLYQIYDLQMFSLIPWVVFSLS